MALQTWEEFLPTLIQARHDKGWSQTDLANKLGVVRSAVGLWESQIRIPAQANAERWANALGITLPDHAAIWFRRKTWSTKPAHGTRNGYHWHRLHNDMPACEPCRKASAEFSRDWRRSRRSDG